VTGLSKMFSLENKQVKLTSIFRDDIHVSFKLSVLITHILILYMVSIGGLVNYASRQPDTELPCWLDYHIILFLCFKGQGII